MGRGFVCVDSDEHSEDGRITEDRDVRRRMVDKRRAKLNGIAAEILAPDLYGKQDYDTLLVGWGSTGPVIREAVAAIGRPDTAFLHFKQVYPLSPLIAEYLRRARKVVVIENNATGQFADLLALTTGCETKHRMLKYDGMPFSVEEAAEGIVRYL